MKSTHVFNFFRPVLRVLLCFLLLGSHVSQAFEVLDEPIAVVESRLILESDFRKRLAHVRFLNPNLGSVVGEDVRERIRQQLIDEELQLILADRAKININDEDIDEELGNFSRQLARRGESIEAYITAIEGDIETVRDQIRKDLKIQRVQQGSLNQRIRITEREVDQFLESKEGQEWLKPRYNLGHILINTTNELPEQFSQSLYQRIQQGAINFRQAAATYSQGPNASQGGNLGWRAVDELPELFVKAADQLDVNQVSQPFKSNAGYHLIKLYQRTGAEAFWVDQYKVRHILVKTSELFTEEEAKEKIQRLYQEAINGADFVTLAKENTDDTGSKFDGGDLGWSRPGIFVPAFENVMNNTAVGDISQPFRSPFGWHILTVEDKRTENMFETVKLNRARSFLRSRRMEDELLIWLQELRENAYISETL